MIDADNLADVTRTLRDRLTFPLGFASSSVSFEAWRGRTAQLVATAIGTAELAPATARVVSGTRQGGATAQRLSFALADGETADGVLLLPSGAGPFPAVLLLHDHGGDFAIGTEKVVAPWEGSADPHLAWAARLYGGRSLGQELQKRGYAVLSIDALGWGTRQGNGPAAQQALAANLLQVGTSLASVVAREDAQAAAYLASHPAVDPARIAAVGFSFGGYRASQVAALSPAIRAVVAVGWMGRLAELMQPGNNILRGQSAFYMLHPALAGQLDFPDFAGLAAPRPALFQAGRHDPHFPLAAVEPAFADMAAIWSAAGAAEALVTQVWDTAHAFPAPQQDAAFDWLDRVL